MEKLACHKKMKEEGENDDEGCKTEFMAAASYPLLEQD
jgi:hypothetical protein